MIYCYLKVGISGHFISILSVNNLILELKRGWVQSFSTLTSAGGYIHMYIKIISIADYYSVFAISPYRIAAASISMSISLMVLK
jgi:hypothetical protein